MAKTNGKKAGRSLRKWGSAVLGISLAGTLMFPFESMAKITNVRRETKGYATQTTIYDDTGWEKTEQGTWIYRDNGFIVRNKVVDGYKLDVTGKWVNDDEETEATDYEMTPEVFSGKSNAELDRIMRRKLYKLFTSDRVTKDGIEPTCEVDSRCISLTKDFDKLMFEEDRIWFCIGDKWSDLKYTSFTMPNGEQYIDTSEDFTKYEYVLENMLKLVLGNNLGSEMFASMKAHADKMQGPGYYSELKNEDGSFVRGVTRDIPVDENFKDVKFVDSEKWTPVGARYIGWDEYMLDSYQLYDVLYPTMGEAYANVKMSGKDYYKKFGQYYVLHNTTRRDEESIINNKNMFGDGCNFSDYNYKQWIGRKTDYGKTITSVSCDDIYGNMVILIGL